jgi:hypothetical protein
MAERKAVIDQFKGPLTPEQAAAGINAARRNAKRLLEDAERLFEAQSFATSCSLAIFSSKNPGRSRFFVEF